MKKKCDFYNFHFFPLPEEFLDNEPNAGLCRLGVFCLEPFFFRDAGPVEETRSVFFLEDDLRL